MQEKPGVQTFVKLNHVKKMRMHSEREAMREMCVSREMTVARRCVILPRSLNGIYFHHSSDLPFLDIHVVDPRFLDDSLSFIALEKLGGLRKALARFTRLLDSI